jgi:hypothetical protein
MSRVAPRRVRSALAVLLLPALTGCVGAHTTPPLTPGTGWGYVEEPRSGTGARRVVYTPDRYVCEKTRYEDASPNFTRPPACVQLTIGRGDGYWLIPALYLPTGSYIGGSTREECEALEQRQSRNLPLPPQGFCRSASVRPAP